MSNKLRNEVHTTNQEGWRRKVQKNDVLALVETDSENPEREVDQQNLFYESNG
jgi:hypothetical protein